VRILFLQKSAGRGGAKSSLIETLAMLKQEAGWDCHVLAGERGPFIERVSGLGIPLHLGTLPEWRKASGRLLFPLAMRKAHRALPGAAFDWVISNEMWWAPHANWLARKLGARAAVILRDGIATRKKARQYNLHRADRILPVCGTILDNFAGDAELVSRTRVVFDSVRLPPAATGEQASQLAARLGERPAVKRWMCVIGKVGPRKNQADAVRVLRLLLDEGHADLGLALVGDGDEAYLEELRCLIAATQTGERVLLLGNCDGITALLDQFTLVLLTSTREGLPRSIVEGLLARRPAFCYPCEGVQDIYGELLTRFVSSEKRPEPLAALIASALADPQGLGPFVSQLEQRADRQFSPASHLAMLRTALTSA
jgi:glycosyltransferase involved in cell wall biosynthesis